MVNQVKLSTETRWRCVVYSEQKKSNRQIVKKLKIFKGADRKKLKRHKKSGFSGRPFSKRTLSGYFQAN